MRAIWRARRREDVGAAAQVTCKEDPTGEWIARACAEPHPKHAPHVCDAGRVETQRLVERRRVLPSPKGGIP